MGVPVRVGVYEIAVPVLVGMDMGVGMLMDMLSMAMRMVLHVTVISVVPEQEP